MKLNLITYTSLLAKQESNYVRETHKELIAALEEHFEVNIIMHQMLTKLPDDELNMVLVGSGGTEGMIVKDYDKLPHPVTLLTDGKANSLAASLELSCWIRSKGDKCSILHGTLTNIIEAVKNMAKKRLLNGKRIGVIGEPSDWLVASNVNYQSAYDRWGVEYVDIDLSKVKQYYDITNDEMANSKASEIVRKAAGCKEPNIDEVIKAVRLYIAIKRIVSEYKLDALTLQCFNLIKTTRTTGCLALSLLNDEGIVAGCEGDLQSVFTMLLVKEVTGKDTFMANPAFIDADNNKLILAHCTIGIKQTERYILRSHFESQKGVAIQGIMPMDPVTIVKVGGEKLDKHVALEGMIVENMDDPRKCRTQIRISLNKSTSDINYFLNNSIGNHHVVVRGYFKKQLDALFG